MLQIIIRTCGGHYAYVHVCEEDEEETRGFIIIYADTSVIPDTAYNGVCRRGGFRKKRVHERKESRVVAYVEVLQKEDGVKAFIYRMGERCWVLSEEEVYYHVGFSDSSAEMNECFSAPSSSIVLVWAAVDARTTRKEARFVLVLPLENVADNTARVDS